MGVRVFGWLAPCLALSAYAAAVLLPDSSKPENRNYEDRIVIPLILGSSYGAPVWPGCPSPACTFGPYDTSQDRPVV